MPDALSYDATLHLLKRALIEIHGNAIAFLRRGQRSPSRAPHTLSPRTWQELATIEALLSRDLEDCIRLELHEEPWNPWAHIFTVFGGLWRSFGSEEKLLRSLHASLSSLPLDQWRTGAPQLEPSLWPFFANRTPYLANTAALALNEPPPYPTLIWLPRERKFRKANA